jgi:hypothetical protein
MAHNRIFVCSAAIAVLLLLLAAGCGPSAGGTAAFVLKFKPGDSANYRLTMENEDNVTFEGSITENPNFNNGYNRAKTEMTFNQQIQSVDDHGDAIAKITIRDIKYSSIRDGNTLLGFDSASEKDRNNPFAKLIGQSYTIEIGPNGQVKKVSDTEQVLSAVSGPELANKVASRLLTPDMIEKIHGTLVLPATDKNQLSQGQSWTNKKTFNYRSLGIGSYEQIYTVKEIKKQGDQQIAVVQMNAAPNSADVNSMREKQAMRTASDIFGADITQTYTGSLEMNLSSGKIQRYSEKLQSQWLIIDPEAEQKGDKEPSSVKMGVIRSYSLERVD